MLETGIAAEVYCKRMLLGICLPMESSCLVCTVEFLKKVGKVMSTDGDVELRENLQGERK